MSPSSFARFKPYLHPKSLFIAPLLLAALISVGCGGISTSGAAPVQSTHTQLNISISPNTLVLASGSKQQFTATVSNTSNSAVTWRATRGTITATGLFTAPIVTANTRVIVSAMSVEESGQ